MQTNEIREKYLEFFRGKGHTVCPSDVLVPKGDPTVLFTPAGMNPFKDHFLGKVKLEFTRAASCQKCLRTGDIENVGRTAYHHTFFEMLGNFSFGDYFKRDTIVWAWEFLTDSRWMGIDPARLTVSVFENDDEAAEIWHREIGLPSPRIARLGERDNFWPAGAPTDGPDGVCGPCSEIFFHPDNGPECEIWNLVFTQFNRSGDPPGNLTPLPAKNIDTGMGLERMAAVMQGVDTNFHIDILLPIVRCAADVCGIEYDATSEHGRRLRRIADHTRACVMAIHENVYPDKQKENYVVRRLLRRALLQGHEIGLRNPFLFQIVPSVCESMAEPYPDLRDTADRIAHVIRAEEENFLRTLDEGLARIEELFSAMQSSGAGIVDGRAAFDLYQEQGIPAEMFESLARDRGLEFDWAAFELARDQHALDSGSGQRGVMGDFGPIDAIRRDVKSTGFLGYACTRDNGTVRGLVEGENIVDALTVSDGQQMLVLDRTPFYAEAGGQVGDCGEIAGPEGRFIVNDTQKIGTVIVHYGRIVEGRLSIGQPVTVEVNATRRGGIERAHSATHILHWALRDLLGEHAQQRGSRVEDDQLRFDFSNLEPVTDERLASIERATLQRIQENCEVQSEILPLEDARRQGAMMLFGEKYPDPVRMVSIGEFSKELCGGTHVARSAEIGEFEIVSEEAVSAGTRRVVALTGDKARQHAAGTREQVRQVARLLGVGTSEMVHATSELVQHVKSLKKQLAAGRAEASGRAAPRTAVDSSTIDPADAPYAEVREVVRQLSRLLNVPDSDVAVRIESLQAEIESLKSDMTQLRTANILSADDLMRRAFDADGVAVIVSEVPGANVNAMRALIDQLRRKNSLIAVFLASIQGTEKIMLLAGLGRDVVSRGFSAGEWVKSVAPIVDGGGGGKPDMAQAGGKRPEKLNEALDAARQFMLTATAT